MDYLDKLRQVEEAKALRGESAGPESAQRHPSASRGNDSPTVEPGSGRPCCWESADGRIRQGRSLLVAMTGSGPAATFWVGIEHADGFSWVREDRLRTRAQYEAGRGTGSQPAALVPGDGPAARWRARQERQDRP